ncbi:hypothetical protein EVAR_87707_1 [Eumeta japonica]|uniref:Uncharacterized protein n=1 Tax=Eumeta variegata TaxID=151549 RepID=A0A4C2ACK1_EUMVA|nr:hypothetical protein EVAR_87707_1 [Eumeta japonica]
MLQDIWRSGIDWDETIEADAHKKWLKWVNDIKSWHRSEYLDAYRPATPRGATCVRRRERKVVRCGRVLAYKIERTRKRSFANSRKLASLLESHIDPRLELKAALYCAQLSIHGKTTYEEADVRTITWSSSPGAPNMGGAWGSAALSNRVGRYIERSPREEFSTPYEAEHIVNSRPLTGWTSEPETEGLTLTTS